MFEINLPLMIEIIHQLGLVGMLALGSVWLQSNAHDHMSQRQKNIIMGLIFGCICSLVMLDPLKLPFGATADSRGGIALMAGIIAGPWGAFITAIIGSATRYFIQGGPVAIGGVVGFICYGIAGWGMGHIIRKKNIPLNHLTVFVVAILGTMATWPSFFVSVNWETGWIIINKIWIIVFSANIIGALLIHHVLIYTQKFMDLQRAYKAHEDRFQLVSKVAEETTNCVVMTDPGGYITWVNRSFERVTGYSLDDVKGHKPGDFLQGPDTDPDTIRRMSNAIQSGAGFKETVLNYAKDGSPYWLDIECKPIYGDSDQKIGFMAIEQDITSSIEKDRQLKKALEESQRSNQAKSQFLANMSHELRTPLNAIIGFSDVIKNGMITLRDDKHLQEYASYINDSGNYLLRIINDILDLSKIEANKVELFPERLKSDYFINECVSYVSQRAKKKYINIVTNIEETYFVIDKTRMQQAILNVITNAVKFSDERTNIFLDYRKEGEFNKIILRDQGIGIDSSDLEKIFDPFTQVQDAYNNKNEGTGLGLSITKRLLELHNGQIQIESELGKGTTVTFIFPDMEMH